MTYITAKLGWATLLVFGLCMIMLTWLLTKRSKDKEDFLLANRNISWVLGGCSIAASWIWAPALFVSTQVAYQKGLAGVFWFTAPNVAALGIFALVGPTIRKKFPYGYTLPQFIKKRTRSSRVHKLYLLIYGFYQLMAVAVQLFAGASLLSLLSGLPIVPTMIAFAAIVLTYTWMSGLRASIITDIFQLLCIFGVGTIILPVIWKLVGIDTVRKGFSGIEQITHVFDPGVAFSFGIVTAIGLLAGALADQQYWQRVFAIKRKEIRKSFLFGSMLFGFVPIAFSTLGFIAASLANGTSLPAGADISMIGIHTVSTLLPSYAQVLFSLALLAGLTSTLDSSLSATSSLVLANGSYKNPIRAARISMLCIAICGVGVAVGVLSIPSLGLHHLWWIFNTVAVCVAIPTVLCLYKKNLSEAGIFWGIVFAGIIGVPLFVYGNLVDSTSVILAAYFFILCITTICCFAKEARFRFSS